MPAQICCGKHLNGSEERETAQAVEGVEKSGVLWTDPCIFSGPTVTSIRTAPERAESLLKVPVGRAHIGHHHGFGVAPQAVLQQARQLGVAVGHMACSCDAHQVTMQSLLDLLLVG